MKKKVLLILTLLSLLMLACNLTSQPANNISEIEVEEAPQITVAEPETASTGEVPQISTEQPETAPAIQDEAPQLNLIAWQEPQTAAFAARVPAGWLVNGNVSYSMGFQHPWVEISAPDGRAAIFYGTHDLQMFLLPHSELTEAGYPEGSTIQENGLIFTIKSHESGEQAAEKALRNWVQPICSGLTVDYARNLNTFLSEDVETSEGVVGFRCSVEGNPMTGEYYLATHKIVDPATGAGVWFNGNPTSFVSLESFKVQAEEAFLSFRTSLTFDSQWQAGLVPVPGAPGLYFSVPKGDNAQAVPFFEDIQADFCARHGGC